MQRTAVPLLLLLLASLLLTLVARVAKSDRLFCGKPPEINHANVADATDQPQDQYEVGTEIVYICQFGYVATGRSRIIRCYQTGEEAKWREPEFSCTPQSCGDPGNIANGYRVGSLFTFPNNVTYHCDVGYILRGIEGKTRYCQTSGQWSGRLPMCEVVTCDDPEDVPNGYVRAPSYEYGATLTYRCDNGYRLSSDEAVYCTENGTWSRSDISCEEMLCEMPEKPQYGYVTFRGADERPRAGNIVIFSCEEGRIPSGPMTSKCLDIGKWTFPAPKCLDPCVVHAISNGVIGKYERKSKWSLTTIFKELEVGRRVNEDEELYIRCYEGFEVPGTDKQVTKVSCSNGRWSYEPVCNPASCRSSPPRSPNAKIVGLDERHDGFVYYECFSDYRKTVLETVVCSYGQWKGEKAQCKSSKCSRDSLNIPGIVKGSKPFYSDLEVFSYSCDYPRYQKPAGHDGQITCIDGTWTGNAPFCVAASCTTPPPSIPNGKGENLTVSHGAVAKYVCDYPYVLSSDSTVKCSFGKWTGQPPYCRDSRCHLKDLSFKYQVSPLSQTLTLSGDKLSVICGEGYSANSKMPVCENGVWKENTREPLCKESGCKIPRIHHGSLNIQIIGEEYFDSDYFRFDRKKYYNMIPEGKSVSSLHIVYLICEDSFTFQGTEYTGVPLQCVRGRWNADPVCLRQGEKYVPTTTVKPRLSIPSTTPLPPVPTSMGRSDSIETASTKELSSEAIPSTPIAWTVTEDEQVTDTAVVMDSRTENSEDYCACVYPLDDDNVVAHVNGKRLSFEDRVQDGSTAVFRCRHVGYHRLIGRTEMTCADCQQWHSSDFPSCNSPQKGNVVIIFDGVKVREDGSLEIIKGQNVTFSCLAVEAADYPKWYVPDVERIDFENESKERKEFNDILYKSHLSITDADYSHEGPYSCFLQHNRNTTINVTVTDPDIVCPEFRDDNNLIITYEKDRQESSKAYFSCADKNEELVGEPVSTCLRTKEWSTSLPYCIVRCKILKESEYLTVHYTKNREVGSTASFHCFAPGVHVGVSSAECLKNGSWSHPAPSCIDVRCPTLNQTDYLVVDYMGDRKINSTATFHCYLPAKRSGVSSTKCLQNGSWAHPIPSCKIQPCTADSLMSSLPHDAQPAIKIAKNDTFSVNTTVKLTCKNDLVVNGNPLATCGKENKWNYDKIECSSGCLPPTRHPNSTLKLSPEKDVYKIGDLMTYSCPPGTVLDSELQVVACLMSGWSEKTIPRCIRDEKKEDFPTTQPTIPEFSLD